MDAAKDQISQGGVGVAKDYVGAYQFLASEALSGYVQKAASSGAIECNDPDNHVFGCVGRLYRRAGKGVWRFD
jgi:hypothetical protein